MIDRLRAKSWDESLGPPPSSILLPNHLCDVVKCAVAILAGSGHAQLIAFGLDPARYAERFSKLVLVAASCHDIGKANSQFQPLVHSASSSNGHRAKQAIRHEWISWFLLQQENMQSWIKFCLNGSELEVDWHIILWAITGHHPAYGRILPTERQNGTSDEIELYLSHPDYRECLDLIAKTLNQSNCTIQIESQVLSVDRDILARVREAQSRYALLWNAWSRNPETVGLLAAVKNCLVAADVAGSALPMQNTRGVVDDPFHHEIVKCLRIAPTDDQLEQLIRGRLTSNGVRNELRPFQLAVAQHASEITLVKAGCGSGKTLAAYHWARTRCPGKRLYVCYPTTGTTTEGFRDYVFDKNEHEPKFGASLFHGRSMVDHRLILETASSEVDKDDALQRIRSLQAWGAPIVTCTVDTVLGIIHNQRRAIYSWPGICNAAFVFDEIHSYDASMFGALLAFLRNLRGVPVLLMTASLPTNRLVRLRKSVKHRGGGLVEISGPEELESLKRYRHEKVSPEEIVGRVRQELSEQGKVLWVSNTVDRTVQAYNSCSEFSDSGTVYHSRFRYVDRIKRHASVINSFGGPGAAIAWTSQVAEMSLDLSATLLVTDLAPISAMIQRLGRLNRRAKCESDPIRPFIVIEPVNAQGKNCPLPYTNDQLDEARVWLSQLPDSISQKDLVNTWESLPASEKEMIDSSSTWIDGGFNREVKELREGSPGVTVIRRADRDRVLSGEYSLVEVTIPMNAWRSDCLADSPRFQGAVIVDENQLNYSELLGGKWI